MVIMIDRKWALFVFYVKKQKKLVQHILLFSLSFSVIVLIDQAIVFTNPSLRSSHSIYCNLIQTCENAKIFRTHPEHLFFLDKRKGDKIAWILGTKSKSQVFKELTELGFRDIQGHSQNKAYIINVFGDSFAFGALIPLNKSIFYILNQESQKCYFRNYAVPGHSLIQMINLSKDKSIVMPANENLFLPIFDDIFRSTRPSPYIPVEGFSPFWKLEKKLYGNSTFFTIPKILIINSFFFQEVYKKLLSDFWTDKTINSFLSYTRQKISDDPTPGELFFIPSMDQLKKGAFMPLNSLKNAFVHSFDEINKQKYMQRYYFPIDSHPNVNGARWIADGLKKRYKSTCF